MIFMLKVGSRYAMGGSGGQTTDDISRAKFWRKGAHVKSHITNVIKSHEQNTRYMKRHKPGYKMPAHEYNTETLAVVPCTVIEGDPIVVTP